MAVELAESCSGNLLPIHQVKHHGEQLDDEIGEDMFAGPKEAKLEVQSPAADVATTTFMTKKHARVKRLALISSEDLKTPTVALPTLALSVVSTSIWGSILYWGAYKKKFSSVLSFPLMTFALFASFTPVHDALHYSVVTRGPYKKFLNNLIGYIGSIPLIIPFQAFRELHMLHHRHTSQEGDPDRWSQEGPMVLRCFKWAIPDYFWIKTAMSGAVPNPKLRRSALYYLVILIAIVQSHRRGVDVIKYWIIPRRAALWSLMWLIGYVPHRLEDDNYLNAEDNVYKMTSMTGGILRSDGFNLMLPLLNHHLHNIHHLYPQLPFTSYGAIWAKHKDALIAAGTEVRPIYSASQGWKWNEKFEGSSSPK
ncbi:hypothetical protein BGZ83_010613 [Gryganskiella cystojenkinii]|nr:hypothetical protein BGZ83_010613 [Gryganskiella cystojenkinii]